MCSPVASESSTSQQPAVGSSPPTTNSDSRTSPEHTECHAAPTLVKPRRRPIPGKGHRKSTRGCFNCKRRRVKCSEDLPRCKHCVRRDVECEYPPRPKEDSPRPGMPLRTTPTVFRLEDLRFFHHFLLTAYPPVPYGSQSTWQSLASMVHEVCP